MTIYNQWKNYFAWLHYKNFIKKKRDKLIKSSLKLEIECMKYNKEIENFLNQKKTHLATLKNINNGRYKYVYLVGKKLSFHHNWFKRLIDLIKKPKQYIFFGDKFNDFNILGIKEDSFLFTDKKRNSLYNLHKKIGTYRKKPFLFIKNPFAISLDINDNGNLYYDYKSYYNYVNKATKINMLDVDTKTDLGSLLKENMKFIIIAIALVLFLMTPEGKDIINQLMVGGLNGG